MHSARSFNLAVPKIAGEIRRFLRDDGAIKVSRSMREQAATIFAAREKLKNTLGREPALSELSEETGFNARRSRSVSWRSLRRTACSAKRATA